jgi:hypothetical protein
MLSYGKKHRSWTDIHRVPKPKCNVGKGREAHMEMKELELISHVMTPPHSNSRPSSKSGIFRQKAMTVW